MLIHEFLSIDSSVYLEEKKNWFHRFDHDSKQKEKLLVQMFADKQSKINSTAMNRMFLLLGMVDIGSEHPLLAVKEAMDLLLLNNDLNSSHIYSFTSDHEALMQALSREYNWKMFPDSSHLIHNLGHVAMEEYWRCLNPNDHLINAEEKVICYFHFEYEIIH